MARNILIALMALGLLAMIAGCGQDSASSSESDFEAIASEFGGYTPTDEAPAFGDPAMQAEMAGDEEFTDKLLTTPEVAAIVNNDETGAYALRIVWGSMDFDSTVTEVTDWSGSLSVTRGAEVIRRLIRFEPWQDYILPRTDRKLIEWVSKTTVHNDGIFVNIYIPPNTTTESTSADEVVTVTFETVPFSITFEISDLTKLDTIYYLDDEVNAVAFRAFKLHPMACPKGFLGGRWGRDSTGQNVFYGRWMSVDGALVGHLKGHWGYDPDSNWINVFYGKYIDITGQFEGLLRGVYIPRPPNTNPNAACNTGGKFYGYFYDANGNVKGVLRGHYRLPRCNARCTMGTFHGRWKTFCPRAVSVDEGFDG